MVNSGKPDRPKHRKKSANRTQRAGLGRKEGRKHMEELSTLQRDQATLPVALRVTASPQLRGFVFNFILCQNGTLVSPFRLPASHCPDSLSKVRSFPLINKELGGKTTLNSKRYLSSVRMCHFLHWQIFLWGASLQLGVRVTQSVLLVWEQGKYLQISFKQDMQFWRLPHKRHASDFLHSQP